MLPQNKNLRSCNCGDNHTETYRGYSKRKEAEAAAAKQAQRENGRKDGVATPKEAPPKPTPEQENTVLAGIGFF